MASGMLRTTEQATVHVKDLDVQLLKDSPAVLLLENTATNIGFHMNGEKAKHHT